MHGNHELIEAVAALILWVGGGLILASMAMAHRRARPMHSNAPVARATGRVAGATGGVTGATGRVVGATSAVTSIVAVRRAEALVLAGLSGGAAAIHLAAGSSHVAELGDLGLAFYWAAMFQAGWAGAILARPTSPRIAWLGIAGNGLILGAWAWSRLVGLPGVPGGAEAVGVADAIAVALQVGIVVLLAAARSGVDVAVVARRSPELVRSVATGVPIVVLGLAAIAVTIAIVGGGAAHAHLVAPT